VTAAPQTPNQPGDSNIERCRPLRLKFECLETLPAGSSPVRVWWDGNLRCYRVGKRIDVSSLDDALPEPATLQKIRHDNVVPILAAPAVEGIPPPMQVIEIVTPYYPRGSLTDAFLRGDQFAPTESVRIVQAALRGLGYLHEVQGILHRDIKSPNILLTDDHFVAKVADLGCAGQLDEEGRTPALPIPTLYSPPELVGSGVLTRASDLYPMGLVLLELLRGGFDYDAYPKTEVARRLMRGVSPLTMAERSRPIWVSTSLRRILNKALNSIPVQRFQSASEMDNALSRAHVIDWVETDSLRWEAPFRHHHGRRVRVEATPRRKGGFRISTQVDRGNGWRRYGVDDLDVEVLDSPLVRSLFDHATDTAIVR
jgi:serine/threonine protein kinase